MKKMLLMVIALMMFSLTACSDDTQSVAEEAFFPEIPVFETPAEVQEYMIANNAIYQDSLTSTGNISMEQRVDTFENGQEPYAIVVTCSDSRVPAEYIFNAGIGEIFVIRNAGNVMGNFDIGSVEYGVEHLGVKLIVIMGHENCGAVAATIAGDADGYIQDIVDEISAVIGDETDPVIAEHMNLYNSIAKCMESEIISEYVASGEVQIVGAYYHVSDGSVDFLD